MKTCNTKINAFLNKSKITKDGTCNVNIVLSATVAGNRIIKKLFTGYNVKPESWDTDKHQIFQNIKGAGLANREIKKIIDKLEDIRFDLEYKNKLATPELILEVYKNHNYESENINFIAFTEAEISKIKKDFSVNYTGVWTTCLNTIKEYVKTDLTFEQINVKFLEEYRYWLRHTKKVKENTIYQHLAFIKRFLNSAISQELTQNYPFKKFKFKAEEVDIEFLTLAELNILHNLFDEEILSKKLQKTLFHFLLSCYTSFRKNDEREMVLNIDKYIIDNSIVFKTQKSDKLVRIPLNPKALTLIKILKEHDFKKKLGYLKQKSDRITNDLTEIIKIAKIRPRKLTFHSSRHTFATTCVSHEIPMRFIQEWMAHSDQRTTQRYEKIDQAIAIEQMNKWQ